MSDVKKINGYNIKDATARSAVDSSAIAFELVSGTVSSIAVDGSATAVCTPPSKTGYKCIAAFPATWSEAILSTVTQGYTSTGFTGITIALFNPKGYALSNVAYTCVFTYIKLPHT